MEKDFLAWIANYWLPQWIFVAVVVFAIGYAAAVDAGEWRVTPGITLGGVYSDNISLAPPGEERSEFVTTVIPAIAVRGVGGRVALGLNYNLELLYRTQEERTDINHELAGDARTELVKNWLYLDAIATFSQANLVDVSSGADNITGAPDRTNVLTYGFRPFISRRLADVANVNVGYEFQRVDNQDSFDSTLQSVTANVFSGPRFLRLPWAVSYTWQETAPNEGQRSQFQNIQGRLGYRLTDQFGVFGIAGYEENNIGISPTSDTSGETWEVGATWTPSRRTVLEFGYGRRFFGETYSLNFSHRRHRLVWGARYTEELTTVSQAEIEQSAFLIEDSITTEPELAQVPLPPLVQDTVFLRRRFEGSLAYGLQRGGIDITIFSEQREVNLAEDEDTVFGGSAAFQRRFSRTMSLTLSGLANQTQFAVGGREDILWNIAAQLGRRFGRRVGGAIEFRHQERDSNLPVNDYTENRISVGLQVAF